SANLRLESDGQSAQVALSPRMLVNDLDVVRTSAIAGVGIALLPAFVCVEELRARKLERVLRGWEVPSTPMHVVYPTARHVTPTVKAFVEHLQQRMSPPPWELGPLP